MTMTAFDVLCHCCSQGALIHLLFLTGLEINPNRPDYKLSVGGVWLKVGSPSQMIHLMELPNPDSKDGHPEHGGRDRHACVSVKDVTKIKGVTKLVC
jgi:glyoxylase I family protein